MAGSRRLAVRDALLSLSGQCRSIGWTPWPTTRRTWCCAIESLYEHSCHALIEARLLAADRLTNEGDGREDFPGRNVVARVPAKLVSAVARLMEVLQPYPDGGLGTPYPAVAVSPIGTDLGTNGTCSADEIGSFGPRRDRLNHERWEPWQTSNAQNSLFCQWVSRRAADAGL